MELGSQLDWGVEDETVSVETEDERLGLRETERSLELLRRPKAREREHILAENLE